MKRRERVLALGLLGAIGTFWYANSMEAMWTSLTSPMQSEMAEASMVLEQLKIELEASQAKEQTLRGWKKEALPPIRRLPGPCIKSYWFILSTRQGFRIQPSMWPARFRWKVPAIVSNSRFY